MKKSSMYIIFILMIVFLTFIVLAASQAVPQTKQIVDCKKNCSEVKNNENKICLNNYKDCRTVCAENKKTCLNETKQFFLECKEACNNSNKCVRNCSDQMIINKENCSKSICLSDCRNESKACKEKVKDNFSECKEGCEINNFEITKEECNEGLYQELCNGPYFDVVCSHEKYCICGGDAGYKCPQGYECNKEIKNLLPRKGHTIQGYRDFLGRDLGDIGVCEKA
jgi:hypothetical protein